MATKKKRESADLEGMLRRMAKALVRRAQEGDTDALVALVEAGKQVRDAQDQAAQALIGFGYSWSDLGRETGKTKQAAQKMWGADE